MINLDLVKLHCRIDHDSEDALLERWLKEADEVIQNDLDRKIIVDESDRKSETDIVDSEWLDTLRLIYIQYRYSRSSGEKPDAYWSLLQKYRLMGV